MHQFIYIYICVGALEVESTLLASEMEKKFNIKVDHISDNNDNNYDDYNINDNPGDEIHLDDSNNNNNNDKNENKINKERKMKNKKKKNLNSVSENEIQDNIRIGTFYTFLSFEIHARLVGSGDMQIEAVKAETFNIDFITFSNIFLPSQFASSLSPSISPSEKKSFILSPENRNESPVFSEDRNQSPAHSERSDCPGHPVNRSRGTHVARSKFLRSSLDSSWERVEGQVG